MASSQENLQAISEQNKRLLAEQQELQRRNAELGVEVKALRLQAEEFERRLAALECGAKTPTVRPQQSASVTPAHSSPVTQEPLPDLTNAEPKPAHVIERLPSSGEHADRPNRQMSACVEGSSENASVEAPVFAQDQSQQSEPKALPDASSWAVDSDRVEMYRKAFSKLDEHGTNELLPTQLRIMFDKAGLPENDMGAVWNLADIGSKGYLNFGDFVCAMFVTFRRTKQNIDVPAQLPDELIASVASALSSGSQ